LCLHFNSHLELYFKELNLLFESRRDNCDNGLFPERRDLFIFPSKFSKSNALISSNGLPKFLTSSGR